MEKRLQSRHLLPNRRMKRKNLRGPERQSRLKRKPRNSHLKALKKRLLGVQTPKSKVAVMKRTAKGRKKMIWSLMRH